MFRRCCDATAANCSYWHGMMIHAVPLPIVNYLACSLFPPSPCLLTALLKLPASLELRRNITPRLAGVHDWGNAGVITATGGGVATGVWRSLLPGLCREWGMR